MNSSHKVDAVFGAITLVACAVVLLLCLASARTAYGSETYTSDLLDEWTGGTRDALLYSPLSTKADDKGVYRFRAIKVPKLDNRLITFCVQGQWGDRTINCMMVFPDGTSGFFQTYLRAQET